jgi:hypothetical protein
MRTMSACQSVALWVSASLFAPSADSSLFLSGVWSPGRQGQGVIFLFYLPDASALSTQKAWEKSFLIRTWLIRWLGAQSPLLLLTSDPPVNISFKALLSWKLAWPDGAKFTRPHGLPSPRDDRAAISFSIPERCMALDIQGAACMGSVPSSPVYLEKNRNKQTEWWPFAKWA